jgi:ubiquinone/menaquinone biosynthesis C-methylase UbiE
MEDGGGGAGQIPFPDAYFDVVCSLNSLDHVDDFDKVAAEIIRVLAPGCQIPQAW